MTPTTTRRKRWRSRNQSNAATSGDAGQAFSRPSQAVSATGISAPTMANLQVGGANSNIPSLRGSIPDDTASQSNLSGIDAPRVSQRKADKVFVGPWPKVQDVDNWKSDVIKSVTLAANDGDKAAWQEWILLFMILNHFRTPGVRNTLFTMEHAVKMQYVGDNLLDWSRWQRTCWPRTRHLMIGCRAACTRIQFDDV